MQKIQIKDIYLISAILMAIVVIANSWNLIVNWNIMNIPGRISFIAGSVLFQLLLFGMFILLFKNTPRIGKIVDDSELDKILSNIENTKEVKQIGTFQKEKRRN